MISVRCSRFLIRLAVVLLSTLLLPQKAPASVSHPFHVNPSYLEGDFDGDGKMDAAVLVKERSTGKLGIAIVDCPTGKVAILDAGIGIGNGGDGLRMDGFLAGQNAQSPTAPWRRTSDGEKRSRQRIDLLEW